MNIKNNFFPKFLALVMILSLIIFSPNKASASESTLNDENVYDHNVEIVNNEFLNVYNDAQSLTVNEIQSDEEAYAILLKNQEDVTINPNNTISINVDKIKMDGNLSENEITVLNDFINRVNSLVINKAITVDKNLLFSFVTNVKQDDYIMPRAAVISIMSKTRSHTKTLKSVFDDAIFSTRHIVAGMYFAERVKSGGAWDYKVQLGTKTRYSVTDLGTTMTGEAIGNFHYGYVGRAVFSGATLKSAAGMYQIISGTSSVKYYDSFFDDPADQAQIEKGIDKYNSEH